MSGVTYRLQAELLGLDRTGAAFAELLLRAGDLTPVMDEIGNYGVSSTQARIDSGVGPDGQAWEPSIRAKTEGGQTLKKDGYLYDTMTHVPSPTTVEWGSNRIYAGLMQDGGHVEAKNADALRFRIGGHWVTKQAVDIPARPFLGIDDADGQEIEAILLSYLDGGFR